MKTLSKFILTSIENHLCDISSENYKTLESILGKDILLKLSKYLENGEDSKFEKNMKELLQDKSIQLKIQELITQNQPKIQAKSLMSNAQTCKLFYGTNRKPNDKNDPKQGYGRERADKIHYGICEVHVPEAHQNGKIKGSFFSKLFHFDSSHGDLELKDIYAYNSEEFWFNLSDFFSPLKDKEKEALVFIHGYNNSFENAAIRAAQISVDLKHPMLTTFFSWPSKGTLLGYLSDEAAIQYSEPFITEFLINFVKQSGAKRIHIIAHSMGNRGLIEAVNRIQKSNPEIKFGQIILAAPDVDAGVFGQLAPAYSQISEQTTLYVSPSDKAVGASKWVHSYPRAGFTPPVSIVPAINTIEVDTDANLLELGHGYFAQQKTLLNDMDKLLSNNLPVSEREQMQKSTENGKVYWKLKS